MNYKKVLILEKLKEIEEREHVKVLHAVESGSRAWGFASPDSDYDVRFIYMRRYEDYVRVDEVRDVIEWELDEVLDINGWDFKKALKHFQKSNATLFEWSNSPVIYKTTDEWKEIYEVVKQYFSCKSAMYHYHGTARKNYEEYLSEEQVKYKKYFYVLRPLLACKWIEEKNCPPPVLFQTLVDEMLEEDMKPVIEKLVEAKVKMVESEKGPRIEKVNAYIVEKLNYYKELLSKMEENKNYNWDDINELFRKMIS